MKVFISWSGDRSRALARALRDWLPMVLETIDVWMSDADIRAGERWASQIGTRLESSGYGVLCMTRENLEQPWILFEAGALARSLSEGAVCPLLLGVEFADIAGSPLSQFQAKKLTREGVFELIAAINERAEKPRDADVLTRAFHLLWPDLQQRIEGLPQGDEPSPPPRSESEVLEELVMAVRAVDRRLAALERKNPAVRRSPAPTLVRLAVDADMPGAGGATEVGIPPSGSLLDIVARSFDLKPEKYNVDWFIYDETGEKLRVDELADPNHYTGRGRLRLTDLPF